jgi:hypothetical protein
MYNNQPANQQLNQPTRSNYTKTHLPGKAGLSSGLALPTSSSGRGGGGGSVDLSILRSSALDFPLVDFDCFPIVDIWCYAVDERLEGAAAAEAAVALVCDDL